MVRLAGNDPAASCMSGTRSPTELKTPVLVRAEDFETPAFPV
jgi:hypothetical protein